VNLRDSPKADCAGSELEILAINEEIQNSGPLAASDFIRDGVKESIGLSLQVQDKAKTFTDQTRLLGDLPELDSMAVLTVITGLEDHFGIVIEDDEISAETFETVGNLIALVSDKLG